MNNTTPLPKQTSNWLYYVSLICSIWFLITCAAWTYLANVVISFPFGLIAFLLWLKGSKTEKVRYNKIGTILLAGVVLSMMALCLFLFFG